MPPLELSPPASSLRPLILRLPTKLPPSLIPLEFGDQMTVTPKNMLVVSEPEGPIRYPRIPLHTIRASEVRGVHQASSEHNGEAKQVLHCAGDVAHVRMASPPTVLHDEGPHVRACVRDAGEDEPAPGGI